MCSGEGGTEQQVTFVFITFIIATLWPTGGLDIPN